MSPRARGLFEQLRARVLEINPGMVELAEPQSVSYHDPSFFLEVLPRKQRLSVLLALDFQEVNDSSGLARDATKRKFFFYAQYEGGVSLSIRTAEDVDRAMPMIRQAHAGAR